MQKAIRFEILRNVKASGRISIPLAEKPMRVATLIDERAFDEDHLLIHHKTVFFEDQVHDWHWWDGAFRYYSRVADVADVLVVYEMDEDYRPAARFDPMTGKALHAPSAGTGCAP